MDYHHVRGFMGFITGFKYIRVQNLGWYKRSVSSCLNGHSALAAPPDRHGARQAVALEGALKGNTRLWV